MPITSARDNEKSRWMRNTKKTIKKEQGEHKL